MQLTSLNSAHKKAGAKCVEFAGYEMPIQYPDGILKEHLWVREHAGLFDVSHMGQATIEGKSATEFLGKLTPSSFEKLKEGKAKYTVLTNEQGGIIDDLIITRLGPDLYYMVINAGCKDKDIAWIKKHLPEDCTFTQLEKRSLIALQGPEAEQALVQAFDNPELVNQGYMTMQSLDWKGEKLYVSRTGYTGEDGFEISVPNNCAEAFWNKLLENNNVQPIGLGARDSLRLEMGYPLYGHDLSESITPVEANLNWIIAKAGPNCFGADILKQQLDQSPSKIRVGIKLLDKGIAREGAKVLNENGEEIGHLTSGGFSPTLQQGVGQGYVDSKYHAPGTKIQIEVRGKAIAAEIAKLPFVPAKTKQAKVSS